MSDTMEWIEQLRPDLSTEERREIARQFDGIDWDRIRRESDLMSIGQALYRTAKNVSDLGYSKVLPSLAAVMDCWRTSHQEHTTLSHDDLKTIAIGFAVGGGILDTAKGLEEEDEV